LSFDLQHIQVLVEGNPQHVVRVRAVETDNQILAVAKQSIEPSG
jgi:hypothetical protein